jgi:hypothetical protein
MFFHGSGKRRKEAASSTMLRWVRKMGQVWEELLLLLGA